MQIPCTHCKQEYSIDALHKIEDKENGKTLYFCCNGCELAYTLLKECNLESFYTKLGEHTLQTKALQDSKKSSINFDSINFAQKYLKDSNGYKEVHIIIDGIVCAACVWLNEQIIAKLEGVISVGINYTTHKAKITFDPNIISFRQIHDEISKIGYNAIVYDPQDRGQNDNMKNRIYYIKLVVAIFCTMNVMWVNVGQYTGFFSGIDSVSSSILNLASFILTTPVLFFCASDFYIRAYKGLRHGVIGMELLVITGTSLVYCYSIYAWLSKSGHTYFESVSMIILFVLGAKFLESLSQKSANDNLCKLNSILPLEARRENGEILSVYDIKIGDRLLVLPGEMLAVDGIVDSENAVFDYANISGESNHIIKQKTESVMAGAMVVEKPLCYIAQKSFEDSSMSKLARLLKESGFSTPKIATSAFKIAGKFSKIVLSIAAISFLYYFFIKSSTFEYALLIAVSVIVIACPCALALATPIASVVGINVGFKNHIIYTKADFLESLAKSDYVVFDKTGTLTEGNMRVVKMEKNAGFKEILDSNNSCFEGSKETKIDNLGLSKHETTLESLPLRVGAELGVHSKNLDSSNYHSKHGKETILESKKDFLPLNMQNETLDSIHNFNMEHDLEHNRKKIDSSNYQNFINTESSNNNLENIHTTKIKNKNNLDSMQNSYTDSDILFALCNHNPHSIAKAIIESLDIGECKSLQGVVSDFTLVAGRGFCAKFKDFSIIGGSAVYMQSEGIDISSSNEYASSSHCYFAYKHKDSKNYTLAYTFYLQDSIKSHAKDLINLLNSYKKQVVILSGDRELAVQNIAQNLGINSYKFSQTPIQKANYIESLISSGHKVVMVGDGLNDSLALKYAQVGIAMGSGSEIALQYSDVIILDDSLDSLSKAFKIAHKTLNAIHQNLVISLAYNASAIPLAFCGFVIPLFAAAFMSVSSLCVVLNSLRLYKNRL